MFSISFACLEATLRNKQLKVKSGIINVQANKVRTPAHKTLCVYGVLSFFACEALKISNAEPSYSETEVKKAIYRTSIIIGSQSAVACQRCV